jgi:F-type H+-transporting ATPase subunit b
MHFDEKFWLALSFIVFVAISYKFIKAAVANLIDKKIAELSAKVVEAETLRRDAEKLLNEISVKIAAQNAENQQLLDEARTNIKNTIENKKGLFTHELNIKYEEAVKKIEQRKSLALIDLHKNFIEIAHSITEKYLKDRSKDLQPDVEIAKKYINS